MSQEKIDRYKEEKANRKKNISKQKKKDFALKVVGVLFALAILGWIVYSGYNAFFVEDEPETITLSAEEMSSLMESLNAQTTSGKEDETKEGETKKDDKKEEETKESETKEGETEGETEAESSEESATE